MAESTMSTPQSIKQALAELKTVGELELPKYLPLLRDALLLGPDTPTTARIEEALEAIPKISSWLVGFVALAGDAQQLGSHIATAKQQHATARQKALAAAREQEAAEARREQIRRDLVEAEAAAAIRKAELAAELTAKRAEVQAHDDRLEAHRARVASLLELQA